MRNKRMRNSVPSARKTANTAASPKLPQVLEPVRRWPRFLPNIRKERAAMGRRSEVGTLEFSLQAAAAR
jgi:hypothetical protein